VQPPASLQALADPIYEAFYGLKEQPFATSTDPKFLFMSASHQRAFEELVTGLRRREAQPFTSSQIQLVKTFADQAVIAIENVRLFTETQRLLNETEARAAELAIINSVQQGL